MKIQIKQKFFTLLVLGCALTSSCAAEYHTLHAGGGGSVTGEPSDEDATPSDTSLVTAQVEVIVAGESVKRVAVGTPFSVRPSERTLDVLYQNDLDCPNPGIVTAQFSLEEIDEFEVTREEPCDLLKTEQQYDKVGYFEINMIVTAISGQQAESSITLEIYDPIEENERTINFRINADPMIAKIGELIEFSGDCDAETPTSISWNLGGESIRPGPWVSHSFNAVGSYLVTARCQSEDGLSATSSLTIVIIPSDSNNGDGSGNGGDGSSNGGDDSSNGGDGSSNGGDGSSNGGDGSSNGGDDSGNGGDGSSGENQNDKDGKDSSDSDDDDDLIDDSDDDTPVNPGDNPGQNQNDYDPSQS